MNLYEPGVEPVNLRLTSLVVHQTFSGRHAAAAFLRAVASFAPRLSHLRVHLPYISAMDAQRENREAWAESNAQQIGGSGYGNTDSPEHQRLVYGNSDESSASTFAMGKKRARLDNGGAQSRPDPKRSRTSTPESRARLEVNNDLFEPVERDVLEALEMLRSLTHLDLTIGDDPGPAAPHQRLSQLFRGTIPNRDEVRLKEKTRVCGTDYGE